MAARARYQHRRAEGPSVVLGRPFAPSPAHARPIGDAEFAAVSLAIDQLLRVLGAG